ncbi:FxsA family protein [Dermatophilaceae bacterium Soc4.6]
MTTPAGGRSRRVRWPAALVVLLLVVPLVEVAVIIAVGRTIGGWPTFGLLLLESAFGAWLVRREGARSWRALSEALTTGRMPSTQLADAALVLVGGTLLLAPGFLTDIGGFLLIVPVTRPLARRVLEGVVARGLLASVMASRFTRDAPGAPPSQAGPDDVVDGHIL